MKTCFKCGAEKPLTDYYKHKKMADGHLNKCKSCTKSDAKNHRFNNLESVRAYDRQRHMNDPDRRKKSLAAAKSWREKTRYSTLKEQESGAKETQKNTLRISLQITLYAITN